MAARMYLSRLQYDLHRLPGKNVEDSHFTELLMTGAWGVSSAGGYPHTINWFEWWDIENDDGDDVAIIFESEKCPHIYHDDDEDGFEEEFCDLNDEICPGSCDVWKAIQKRIQ